MSDAPKPTFPVSECFPSAEGFLQAFVASSGGLVSYVDTGERIVFATQRLAEWFGTTTQAIVYRVRNSG